MDTLQDQVVTGKFEMAPLIRENAERVIPAHRFAGVRPVGFTFNEVLQAFEISEAVYLFELDVTALLSFATGHKKFQPIPRFPAVFRDIALVVDAGVTHRQVYDIINSFTLVQQATLFDVYSGEQVPLGKKSLAFKLTFQFPDHTLTDEEVDKVQQQILNKLSKELGATLRS